MAIISLEGKDPEGATPLEDEEMLGLKLGFISSRAQLDVAEYSNIALADLWLKRRQRPVAEIFTVSFLQELHVKMFNQVWNWAGSWRTRTTNIG